MIYEYQLAQCAAVSGVFFSLPLLHSSTCKAVQIKQFGLTMPMAQMSYEYKDVLLTHI